MQTSPFNFTAAQWICSMEECTKKDAEMVAHTKRLTYFIAFR